MKERLAVAIAIIALIGPAACGGGAKRAETAPAQASPTIQTDRSAVPTVTPVQPTSPTSPAAGATQAPSAGYVPPTPALNDEEVLAAVDSMLTAGIVPGIDLSFSNLDDVVAPYVAETLDPGDTGRFDIGFQFSPALPALTVTPPKVAPISGG